MKFNFDIKNKKVGLEADVEKIVEKSIGYYDKDWKDKFNAKHHAKKEMLEMKHKHKMELEEKKQNKKTLIQKIQEGRIKAKQLKLEEKRRKEEEQKRILKIKIIISAILGVLGSILLIAGFVLGSESGNPDSGWYAMAFVGIFSLCTIGFIWIDNSNKKK